MREAAQVHAAVREQRWDDLVELSESYFSRVAMNDSKTWLEAFDAVPDGWLDEHPRQRYLVAIAECLAGDIPVIDGTAVDDMRAWIGAQHAPLARDRLLEAVGRLQFLRMVGRNDDALEVAEEIERIVATTSDFVNFDDVLPPVLIAVGNAFLHSGKIERATSTFSQAVRWSRIGRGHPVLPHARNYLALSYALSGKLRLVETTMDVNAGRRTAPRGSLGYVFENASIMLPAVVALNRLDQAQAAEAIEAIDEAAMRDEYWWLGVLAKARFALFWGDRLAAADSTAQALTDLQSLSRPGSLALTLISAALAELQHSIGDLAGAAATLKAEGVDQQHQWVSTRLYRLHADPQALKDAPTSPLERGALVDIAFANAAAEAGNLEELAARVEQAASSMRLNGTYVAAMEATPQVRRALAAALGEHRLMDEPYPWPEREPVRLNTRELEILEGLACGHSLKRIAAGLFLSVNTAKTYRTSLYRTLQVNSSFRAVEEAKRLGLLAVGIDRSVS